MIWELRACNTDGRYPNDVRYRRYTDSKVQADLFERIPKIQFTGSGHGIVFQAWPHAGRRLCNVGELGGYVSEQLMKLKEVKQA